MSQSTEEGTGAQRPTESLFAGKFGALYDEFLRHRKRDGAAVALIDDDDVWTYDESFEGASLLARYLNGRGVGNDDLVVVIGERCAAFVMQLLGVSMSGARFVVLDRQQVSTESVAGLHRLRPKYWLSLEQGLRSLLHVSPFNAPDGRHTELPSSKREFLAALSSASAPVDAPNDVPRVLPADARAYAVWTSGTTHAPKLVSTRHGSVVNFIDWYRNEFRLVSSDRFSMLSGLGHDPVLRDIFAPLSIGASICVPSERKRLTPSELLDWIVCQRITVMHLTPSMFDRLVRTTPHETIDSVRVLAFGGQNLLGRHVAAARRLFPNAAVVNFYGATETPQAMGYHRVDFVRDADEAVVPIGKGIRGAELLVLDEQQQQCPTGKEGEIYVRSRFLAEGYIDLPEATRARFLTNPLTADPSDRVYRTGDLGVYREDGGVRLHGRCDRQIKIDGHRIDLDDIESELAKLPVAQSAALFDEHRHRIVAFIVEAEGAPISESALRESLARTISVYAVPARIIVVDTLPMTGNGKIDYAMLFKQLSSIAESTAAPTVDSRLGPALLEIWRSELRAPDLGVRDSFYELGGDSIVAHRIVDRIREELDIEIRAADLFIYPTIEALDRHLAQTAETVVFDTNRVEALRTGRRNASESARKRQGRVHG